MEEIFQAPFDGGIELVNQAHHLMEAYEDQKNCSKVWGKYFTKEDIRWLIGCLWSLHFRSIVEEELHLTFSLQPHCCVLSSLPLSFSFAACFFFFLSIIFLLFIY
ncbi:hypothetical protein PRUPE_2G188100 [Prunus persica]|uniref:Uncharacterized protein n=1 Tax=Prunus persica TaxID=3760 RepID=A0A251QL70_PRUPE|nr:hypothetical protein PRUPE_2G188100 [Prunus persica]